jgi:hypothetical protein
MKSKCLASRLQSAFSSAALFTIFLISIKPAQALTLYDDRSSFLNDTNATETSLENVGIRVESFTLDDLTFTIARPEPETLNLSDIRDWATLLPGVDLAVNGVESFDIDIANPVNSLGFDFVEPEFDPSVNGLFIDSIFEITLLDSGNIIDSFEFTRPNDVATFVGFSSDFAFNKVEIREIIGGAENEFFGSFYTSVATTSESVPEPGLILGLSALGLGVLLKKRV